MENPDDRVYAAEKIMKKRVRSVSFGGQAVAIFAQLPVPGCFVFFSPPSGGNFPEGRRPLSHRAAYYDSLSLPFLSLSGLPPTHVSGTVYVCLCVSSQCFAFGLGSVFSYYVMHLSRPPPVPATPARHRRRSHRPI